jgi:predicted negative regulator of RcsB-dependent stress response
MAAPMSSHTNESTALYDLVAWLEVHKKQLAIAAGALIVAGFGYSMYQQNQVAYQLDANEALVKASSSGMKREGRVAVPAADYQKVADAFPNTAAGERAFLLSAGALFTEGKFTEAKAKFDQFAAAHPESSLGAVAAYGAASCLDSMNQLDPALAAYQKVVTGFANEPEAVQAKLAIAAIHEANGKPADALKLYNEIKPASPDISSTATLSSFASEADARRQLLYLKHPELAPAPSPKPSAANLGLPSNIKLLPNPSRDAKDAKAPTPPAPQPAAKP